RVAQPGQTVAGPARRCSRRARAAEAWVPRSARNANATRNHPKPVTPLRGAYATAHANVVHGRNSQPAIAIQPELNAIVIRSVNAQSRKTASRGESIAASATRHPHIGARL